MAKTFDEQVDELVDKLGCSIKEAEQILRDDKKIDKGEAVDFGLVYKFDKKERKADTTKEGVIQALFDFLVENGYAECEVLNKSKLISFKIADDTYELDLKRKRKPKN